MKSPSEPIGSNSVAYSKEGAEHLRSLMIELRNEALNQNEFAWSVNLSHVIGFMSTAIAEIWEEQ